MGTVSVYVLETDKSYFCLALFLKFLLLNVDKMNLNYELV